ncbi:hypothetical protein IGI96_001722 [Enterococcus sp. DIV0421]|uniref:hypothetical protein n=1 Tax=Enterococcus sp. DIV0421 TaxID=2774688 RepID=UPI003F28B09F
MEEVEPDVRKELEAQVREILRKQGYLVDSYFEGDYKTWIGVYARPEDKPTYLDPATSEAAFLQNKYRIDGFKQDFAEWFEWPIEDGVVQS